MQHASVEKLFKEQVKQYAHEDQYKHSPLKLLILEWLKNKQKNKKINICEFGGGAGQLLGKIRETYPQHTYTDIEIIDDYRKFLVSKNIKFIVSSVLDSHFPDNSFDVIIMRDVLHHLVGRNYQENLENQKIALRELKRLVRPKGVIFIEELTNKSEIATRIIYYLTWLNSRFGIRIPSLFISPHIIVSFLTANKLYVLCTEVFGKQNTRKNLLQLDTKWYFALLHLFGKLEKTILTLNK